MKYLPLFIALAACSLAGCHKKEAAGSTQPAAPQDSTASTGAPAQPGKPLPPPPLYVTANADNTPRQSVVGDVDPFLTEQLRSFAKQKGRLPQSFFEFTSSSLDSIPRPPAGKKWVIDASDLQVKAVPAQSHPRTRTSRRSETRLPRLPRGYRETL